MTIFVNARSHTPFSGAIPIVANIHGPRFTWIDTLHLGVAVLYVVGIFTKIPAAIFDRYKDQYFDEIAVFSLSFFAVYMTAAATYFLYRWRNERYKVIDARTEAETQLAAAKIERDQTKRLVDTARERETHAAADLEYLLQWCSEVRHHLMCVMRKANSVPENSGNATQNHRSITTDYLTVMRTFGPTFLSNTKRLFKSLSGQDDCASCIKTIEWNGNSHGEGFVRTEHRDPDSARVRRYDSRVDPFHYKLNTVFRTICDEDDDVFACDDLDKLPNYQSAGKELRSYNSTIVSALRTPGTSSKADIIGFVCVDNKTGNLDNDVCRKCIAIAARAYYDLISLSDDVFELLEKRGLIDAQEFEDNFRVKQTSGGAAS